MTISRTSAFTMLELLMVIVIIGVLSALTVPTVTGGDMTRVKSASRALMQMSRYARTMAVLHQCTVELHIYPDGRLAVLPRKKQAANSDAGGGGEEAPSLGNEVEGDEPAMETDFAPEDLGGEMVQIEEEQEFKQIVFELECDKLLTDSEEERIRERGGEDEDDEGEYLDEAAAAWVVPFGGNGRCPPFNVKVMSADNEGEAEYDSFSLEVHVDRFGSAKVYDEKDSRRD